MQVFVLCNSPFLYAPQAVDGPDGCVMIGWMPGWGDRFPTQYLSHRWCGCMSFPRILRVRNDKVYQEPIPALCRLRSQAHPVHAALNGGDKLCGTHTNRTEFCLNIKTDAPFELELFAGEQNGFLVSFDPETKRLGIDRNGCGHSTKEENEFPDSAIAVLDDRFEALELHIIQDTCTVEMFANHGEKTLSACVYPIGEGEWQWRLAAQGACDVQGAVYELKRADEIE